MPENTEPILEDFKNHLTFERQLSRNTLEAYIADTEHYLEYCAANELRPETVPPQFLDQYVYQLSAVENLSSPSVLRKLEAVKCFYKFLLIEGRISEDPTRFLKSPKKPQRMPEQPQIARQRGGVAADHHEPRRIACDERLQNAALHARPRRIEHHRRALLLF